VRNRSRADFLAGDGDRFRLRLLYLQANWKRIGDGEFA
jgi:hypothetical protein